MVQQNQFPFSEQSQENNGGSVFGGLLVVIGLVLATLAVNHFAQKDASNEN